MDFPKDDCLGPTIYRLLREQGKTQAELARYGHWSPAYVSKMIHATNNMPSLQKAKRIADFFGLTLDQLWEEHMVDEMRQRRSSRHAD
ncbi:MAG: helix-turn-helix domain-containing protein [Parafannyhessea sp.]|uniref:helix-turn-helix domain-containing protein n=1 Tax=Parafannyhessea sp. TaxID=2847324 RepID=UPI003F086CF1